MLTINFTTDKTGAPLPAFSQRTTIDGTAYQIDCHWNTRAAAWFFGFSDPDTGAPILQGLRMELGALFRGGVDPALPGGLFFLVDTTGAGVPPTLTDLGQRVVLYYATADEVAAALA